MHLWRRMGGAGVNCVEEGRREGVKCVSVEGVETGSRMECGGEEGGERVWRGVGR